MRGNTLSRVRAFIPVVAAAALLGGCAVFYAPQARPLAEAVPARPKALRAEAVVELRRSIPLTGRARVLVESPDKFRIEVMGPFNQVIALLVSDGRELFVFSGRPPRIFNWEDPSMPYPFSAGEVVSFLMGEAGAPPAMNRAAGSWYSVTTDGDGRVKDIVKSRGGTEVLSVALADYRKVSGAYIPFNISIDGRERFSIRYSEVEIDPDVEPGSFSIPSVDR
ncbi:MAG: hypothetical protein HZB22_00650 [Deltaproteobacteria bacterium]|nr:hypothetical protein [Deltaproteobacteria bacterium]